MRVLEAIWDVITTAINAIIETAESIVGWVLSLFSGFVILLFLIPVVGRLVKWIWNILLTALWFVVGILDFLVCLAGVKPEKKLRVSALILKDTSGPVANRSSVVTQLQHAVDVFASQANVRVIRSWPLQYDSGLAGNETANDGWVTEMPEPSGDSILNVGCNLVAAGEDLWIAGVKFELLAAIRMVYGNFRRLIGYGAPVPIFVVKDSGPPSTIGCSLGPLADYVTVEGGNPVCIAHELGHACNLWHVNDSNNLMYIGSCNGQRLSRFQIAMLRASRHVTYF